MFRKATNLILIIAAIALNQAIQGQTIPAPKNHFGFNIGDDYRLATYTQTEAYFRKLAESDRVRLADIGPTEEGRRQYMLIISSPANLKDLEKYRDISVKLARAEGITLQQAKDMADQGKAVVWIDGGLHATEVVGSHQLIETAWQLVSRNDRETLEILDNVIVLLVHANPDGQELVSSWYMQESDSSKRRMNIPRLYQKYAGHDNNRDFYMQSLQETKNMSRQLYIDWIPQVLYNHHQSGPAGTVLAGPPYRDPFNYVFDPLVMTTLDALGAAMVSRLNAEGKPGYTQRSGAPYSTWYNGGLRTTSYFHNIAGLLTEIIGNPTPGEIPFVPDRLLASGILPYPIAPQKWHFRQSIDYSVSLNYAVMSYASRHHSELLYNIYRMGLNSIERGSKDYWTITPKDIDAAKAAYNAGRGEETTVQERPFGSGAPGFTARIPLSYYEKVIKDPGKRDPRAYIIPADQADFPTAVWFINTLIRSGIKIHRAEADFTAGGKKYPAGSYVVFTAQAFRPYVIDIFEPQDHPNDLQYPGGPPVAPYDGAGWTLAFQMGVEFDRILESFEGPFISLPYGETQPVPGKILPSEAGAGYIFSPSVNNSFRVVNDLLRDGINVYRVTANDTKYPEAYPGSFFVPNSVKARGLMAKYASDLGVSISIVKQKPAGTVKLSPARVAIWNRYGGSMPSGWISWILEQFQYPYSFIFPQGIDSGNLRNRYDVIIFPSGAIPAFRRVAESETARQRPPEMTGDGIPGEYRGWTGSITPEKSIPQIKRFIEEGGVVLTIGSSTSLGYYLDLPVKSALVKKNEDGSEVPLRNTEFYIPGSLVSAEVDTSDSACWGMPSRCDFYFDQSPVFRLEEEAAAKGVKGLAWFSDTSPLRSGWALGQSYLEGGVAAYKATVGKGTFFAFGPEITFRSQPHNTFRMMFNQLYRNNR